MFLSSLTPKEVTEDCVKCTSPNGHPPFGVPFLAILKIIVGC